MNRPSWTKYWTLDEVAECLPVSGETGRELWAAMVEDTRKPEEDWDPASWKLSSPNLVHKRWKSLSDEVQIALKEMGKKERL